MRVSLFIPCFVNLLYPRVGIACVELLESLGLQVDYPQKQTCCGQPAFNSGHRPEALEVARHCNEVFADSDVIVCPSGSCTSMLRTHYPGLDPKLASLGERVFELSEFLVNRLGLDDLGAKLPGRGVLHVGCHLRNELQMAAPAQRLLAKVEGLELIQSDGDEWCCGFGGTFAVKYPELSVGMSRRKLDELQPGEIDYLISTESSCLMQMAGVIGRRDGAPRAMHLVEALLAGKGGH